jgi:putative nucleotidyltransferase with HDIG domain
VRLLGELEQLFLDTIRAIAATVDAKDGYTHRHSERVAAFARRIAAELGRSEEEQELVEWAALLHDVGKIAVPDSILNKRDRLDTDEYAAMKEHPAHGARILANIQSRAVREFLPGVRAHHERWDGTGYPDGLRGDAIPLFGRIVGVADFLDALTSARSYRPAEPLDRALERLHEGAGSHFDPAVVRAVFALHARGELADIAVGR